MRTYSHFRISALRFFRIAYCKSSIFLSCFFAGMSLTWIIAREMINAGAPRSELLLLGFIAFGVVLIMSMLMTYAVGYYTLSPKKYAKITISGRRTTEALQYLSKNIAKLCQQCNRITNPSIHMLEQLEDCLMTNRGTTALDKINAAIGIWKAMGGDVMGRSIIEEMKKLRNRQSRRMKRIDAMKVILAKEHNITERKLANHILSFSMFIYKDRYDKQLRDWQELCKTFENEGIKDVKGVETKDLMHRISGLVHQLIAINRVTNGRIRRQHQLMRFDFLCDFCIDIANERSSSSGINLYAQTISNIAELALSLLHKTWWRKSLDNLILQIEEILVFVYHKQQAYSGYDLHELMISLVQHIREDSKYEDSHHKLTIIEGILKGINAKGDDRPMQGNHFFYHQDQLEIPRNAKKIKEVLIPKLNFLADLSILTNYHLCADQAKVMDIYKYAIFPKFFEGKPGNRYIVTHGYSKITRQILKHALPNNDIKKNIVYILSDDTFNEDARLLKYELKSETRKAQRKYGSIAIGGYDNLQAQYDPDKDSMILILGADCYDAEGRILFHRSLKKLLRSNIFCNPQFRMKKNILVTIAVESYKALTKPLTESVAYDDHLDQVQIISKEMYDLIIDENVANDSIRQQSILNTIAAFKRNGMGPIDNNRLAG